MTDNIIDAIKEEMDEEHRGPKLTMGDFNAAPVSLDAAIDLIEGERWTDEGRFGEGMMRGGGDWR